MDDKEEKFPISTDGEKPEEGLGPPPVRTPPASILPHTPEENDGPLEPKPAPENVEHEYITGFLLFSLMASITIIAFLMMLDISIIATAVPRITSDFHSLQDVGWYGAAYQLSNGALLPLTGKFYTHFRTKRLFLIFVFIFELGSLLCGVATSSNMLIIGRAVAGLGASGILNGGLTMIAWSVPLHKRPFLVGVMFGLSQLGVALGPLVGGAFTEFVTWRWCFYINLPVGSAVAFGLLFIKVPDDANKTKVRWVFNTILTKFDLIGFLLFAPAAIQFLLALQYGGNQFAWNSSTVIGLFCGAGATFILFLVWEYCAGDEAMMPFSMMGNRIVWSSCLTTFFMMSTVFCASYYLPIYFQGVRGVSPMTSGVDLLPSILSQILFTMLSGALVGKLGYYLPAMVLCGVLTAVAHGLISTFSPSTTTGQWVGYQILLGAGRGIGMQMPIIAIQNALPNSQVSVAMSILMFSQTFGGGVYQGLGEVIFSSGLRSNIVKNVPSIDPEVVIAAGATSFRNVVSAADLGGVVLAYSAGVDQVFYFLAGSTVASFVTSWAMGWKDIRKKEASPDAV